ncbi:MAG: enoyl-CoA hydratase/isomerase family protein [Chloroflexi bacterium]|nr:enoyl-CoA hydratase/isomerase family protein [Chloroflexota bacterium]
MLKGRDILLTEKRGHIYIMTINREERRNAISEELLERIPEEWEYFNEDDDLWVAIFTGAGDIAFSAGHDMKEDVEGDVRGGKRGSHKAAARRRAHPDMMTWKPTIAAINGYCLAGGWWLAQHCDIRIAAEHATFGMPEVNWNLPAMFGAQHEYVISIGVAAEMLLWGRSITAQRAYEIGFVNKVVPKGKQLEEALEWAEYMCKLGQPSVRAHKQGLYQRYRMSPSDLTNYSRDLFYWYPPKPGVVIDGTEGARAFTEGRKSVGSEDKR